MKRVLTVVYDSELDKWILEAIPPIEFDSAEMARAYARARKKRLRIKVGRRVHWFD